MKKLKVTTIVGTRPEIIRLSSTIKRLDAVFEHKLVHTGQNYDFELNEIFFEDLGLRMPDIFLNSAVKSNSALETIGNLISQTAKTLAKDPPDAILILGDTNSCLSALPAKRMRIPVFHLEAGNRCFDERVPEEINRRIVDHISDINLTYSTIARDYLLREGLSPDRVIKVGSPMKEVISDNQKKINESQILKKLKLKKDNFFLVSSHREENIESSLFLNLIDSLNSLAEKYKLPLIISTHPRTRKKLKDEKLQVDSLLNFINPLGFSDYLKLQMNAKVVLSDSGTITEESSIMQFNAINLREAHERPEGMEEGSVIMSGLGKERILQSIEILLNNENQTKQPVLVGDYDVDNVSEKVARIIMSYTDYVRRNVWREYN